MKAIRCIVISSIAVLAVAVSQAHAQTASVSSVNRVCSVRPAAALLAQSLALKIKAALDQGAAAAKRSPASVRVGFSPPKSRPAVVKVDFSKDVTVSIDLASATNKINLQGAPTPQTMYQTCDPGKITFTVSVSYRDLSKTPATQVTFRQTVEATLPGQFL